MARAITKSAQNRTYPKETNATVSSGQSRDFQRDGRRNQPFFLIALPSVVSSRQSRSVAVSFSAQTEATRTETS